MNFSVYFVDMPFQESICSLFFICIFVTLCILFAYVGLVYITSWAVLQCFTISGALLAPKAEGALPPCPLYFMVCLWPPLVLSFLPYSFFFPLPFSCFPILFFVPTILSFFFFFFLLFLFLFSILDIFSWPFHIGALCPLPIWVSLYRAHGGAGQCRFSLPGGVARSLLVCAPYPVPKLDAPWRRGREWSTSD